MHAVVMDSLEDYLSGTLEPEVEMSIEAHLRTCSSCREELRGIQDVSQLLFTFRPAETVEPPSGFYAKVMEQVRVERPAPSFASLFALDFAFGRRLVFASLLTLAVLGTYLVSRESLDPIGPTPEAIMAQQESPAFYSAPAHDNMLVTLAAYEQH
jgi:predicted anti-sigma-YlaC factor YlaD